MRRRIPSSHGKSGYKEMKNLNIDDTKGVVVDEREINLQIQWVQPSAAR